MDRTKFADFDRLKRRGHQITIYDARREPPTTGAGLMLRPNASRVLSSWGLGPRFSVGADVSRTTSFLNLATGDEGERREAIDVSDWPDWGLGRSDAWKILHSELEKTGVVVQWGRPVEGVMARGEGVRVRLGGGRMQDCDLVLDATGAHSRLRRSVLGIAKNDTTSPCDPRILEGTSYNFAIPEDQVAADPDARMLLEDTRLRVWIGSKGRYVVQRYHEVSGEVTLMAYVTDDEQQDMKGYWDENGDMAHLRAKYQGDVCAPLAACMRMATACSRWKWNEMPDLPHWVHKSGRIGCLGDACHAMIPNAAQGFSQTVEDIGVLDCLLNDLPDTSVPEIMRLWESIRMPRVNRIKEFARWNTEAFAGMDTSAMWKGAKDRETIQVSLKDVKPDGRAALHSRAFLKWVMDYDAVGEAKKVVAERQARPRL